MFGGLVEEYFSPRDVCRMLGISYITLWRWIRDGKIRAVRTPSGRYAIPRSEIDRIRGTEVSPLGGVRAVIYARVSSAKQKKQGDLDRQVEVLKRYAVERGYVVVGVITDVSSGLKENRRGLGRLLKMVVDGRIDVVLVTRRDRLTRFGFKYLQFFFEKHGVTIEEVMYEAKEPLEELVEDFVEIIVSFARRIYGKRSHKARKLLEITRKYLQETLMSEGQ